MTDFFYQFSLSSPSDGSYYYKNTDGSTYHNSSTGGSTYTSPSGYTKTTGK